MSEPMFVGEHRRLLDDRYRVAIPGAWAGQLTAPGQCCVLAKEQVGALSLWRSATWTEKLDQGLRLIQEKIHAGRLDERISEVQALGRLLSTRHTDVSLAGRGRLVIPEGFREFLGVEPGHELLVVGAALCVELWRPAAWFAYVQEKMPEFRRLFTTLSS